MRSACVCLLLGATLVAGCASSSGESYMSPAFNPTAVDRVAITSITGQIYGESAKNTVATDITMELFSKGYRIMDRANMKEILEEQHFQASAITSNQDAARAGKVLNVPFVMIVDIPEYSDEKMQMNVKLVDVETAELMWVGTGSSSTGRTAATIFGAAAGAVGGAVLGGGDSSDRTVGAVLGGLAGGAAGYALSPEQQKQVQKAVQKTFANFPSRNVMQPAVQ